MHVSPINFYYWLCAFLTVLPSIAQLAIKCYILLLLKVYSFIYNTPLHTSLLHLWFALYRVMVKLSNACLDCILESCYYFIIMAWLCSLAINTFNINMFPLRPIYLGHSYFASPDYTTVHTWISITLLHLDNITLVGLSLYKYTEFYTGMIWHTLVRVLCHIIAAMLSIVLDTIVTVYPMVWHQIRPNTKSALIMALTQFQAKTSVHEVSVCVQHTYTRVCCHMSP